MLIEVKEVSGKYRIRRGGFLWYIEEKVEDNYKAVWTHMDYTLTKFGAKRRLNRLINKDNITYYAIMKISY